MDLIVAVSKEWAIGYKGGLLFNIPDDMKYFRETTKNSVVIMGRTTLDSFPGQRPLKNRVNIVFTKNIGLRKEDVIYIHNYSEISNILKQFDSKKVFVIGGETIYKALLPFCENAYVTKVDAAAEADRFFPNLDIMPEWTLEEEGQKQNFEGLNYQFTKYKNTKVHPLESI